MTRKPTRTDLLKTLEETASTFKLADHPEWATSRDVAQWVRSLRQGVDHLRSPQLS
jgi:hypothetical protein